MHLFWGGEIQSLHRGARGERGEKAVNKNIPWNMHPWQVCATMGG
jgi:hypothetical protein